MQLNPDECYEALRTRDSRFDGVFFVGVSTTKIYCRPICSAKVPARDRCTFYRSAAEAEQAGYRPCLRCRPELAPGNAPTDSITRIAQSTANLIQEGFLSDYSLTELAEQLGLSDRHLRRIISQEFGVSPVQLAQTQRLLHAKRLLTETNMSMGQVAFAAGFSSVSRFNTLFQERYRLNPSTMRKNGCAVITGDVNISEIAYRPPFDWESLLSFFRSRMIPGVEEVTESNYKRTLAIGKYVGWISVTNNPTKNRLRVDMSSSLMSVILPVLTTAKRVFDLSANPQIISAHLGNIAEANPGLRVPGAFDGFETAVRAILGQQVSVKAATTLAGRFARAFGTPCETPFESLATLFPTASDVKDLQSEQITALGILPARANAIIELANAVDNRRLCLLPCSNIEKTINGLKQLPCIGEWTAQYIAMRALAWPDSFPHTDLGIYSALGETNPKRVLEIAEKWRPWRSYATMHLWKSLENPKLEVVV